MNTLSEQQIIGALKINYDINAVNLISLPWGADTNAAVYKAQSRDSSYFVKLKRGHSYSFIAELTRMLHDAGISQVIPPLNTTQGKSTQRIDDFTLIVYPFIEGEDGFRRSLTDAQWISLGKTMKQVHELQIPLSLQNQIRKESYSAKWREAVRSLYVQMESEITADDVANKIIHFMKLNKVKILQLVEHAEQLSQEIQKQSVEFVFCHSDIHGGNVLIDNNHFIYIVDWDEPIMAPKERDLMFIGGGVANVWNQPQEEALFYQGYGKCKVNKELLAYYRHERIVEDIAIYGHELLLSRAGGENRSIMFKHFLDMFEPNGVVEIALNMNVI